MSAVATVKPQKPPRYWFLAQPLTGRLWRIDARSARVFAFEWAEKRQWREIEREAFERQAREHDVVDLSNCKEVPLCGQ